MFKFVTFAALVAVARVECGGIISPAAISYAAPAAVAYSPAYTEIHAPAIGSQSQSVVRSLDGNSAVSQYSKAVDTAFSSVRKYDTRVTNDAKFVSYSAAPLSYAAPAALQYAQYAAPAAVQYAQYSAPAVVKTLAQPAVYAAPQYAHYAAAPAVVKTLAQPAVYAAAAPAVVKTLAQPALYAAPQYAHYAAAPAVVKTLAQPAVYAAPQYAQYAQYAAPAPIVKSPLIAHTSFTGLGTSYVY